mmetsp:Transcript_17205/g.41700  ORF Transcript_17205/g.41700 Transcript_17205/m.41700 type:complete len:641 (-) Transcript_17205:27-1949(-)
MRLASVFALAAVAAVLCLMPLRVDRRVALSGRGAGVEGLASRLQSDESEVKKFLAKTVRMLAPSRRESQARVPPHGELVGREGEGRLVEGADRGSEENLSVLQQQAKRQIMDAHLQRVREQKREREREAFAQKVRVQMREAAAARHEEEASQREEAETEHKVREEERRRAKDLRLSDLRSLSPKGAPQHHLTPHEEAFVRKTMSSPMVKRQVLEPKAAPRAVAKFQAGQRESQESRDEAEGGEGDEHHAPVQASIKAAGDPANKGTVSSHKPQKQVARTADAAPARHEHSHSNPARAASQRIVWPNSDSVAAAEHSAVKASEGSGLKWPKASTPLAWPARGRESGRIAWPDGQSVHMEKHAAAEVPVQLHVVMLVAGTSAEALSGGKRKALEHAVTEHLGWEVEPDRVGLEYATDVPGLENQAEVSLKMQVPAGENCRLVAERVRDRVRSGRVDESLRALGRGSLEARLLALSGCTPETAGRGHSTTVERGQVGGDTERQGENPRASRDVRHGPSHGEGRAEISTAQQVAAQTAQLVASEVEKASAEHQQEALRRMARRVAERTARSVAEFTMAERSLRRKRSKGEGVVAVSKGGKVEAKRLPLPPFSRAPSHPNPHARGGSALVELKRLDSRNTQRHGP